MKRRTAVSLVCAGLIVLAFCSFLYIFIKGNSAANNSEADIELYNNNIFTRDLYENITKIYYLYGSKEIDIRKKDLYDFYMKLASLKLTEKSDDKELKVGHQLIKIITKDQTIHIGLLSNEIVVNSKRYTTDKNIASDIREIALRK